MLEQPVHGDIEAYLKYTYNIIDIGEDGKIDIDIKIVGGKSIPLSEVVNRYEPDP